MPEPIFDFPLIHTAIRPLIHSLTGNPIIREYTLIHNTITPSKFTFAIEQPIIELALVSVAIFECYWAWAI